MLIFSFYPSSGFYQRILSPYVPTISTRFPARIQTQAAEEKLTTTWTSEISSSVGMEELNTTYVFSLQNPFSYLKPPILVCHKYGGEQPVPNQELMDTAEQSWR